MRTSIARLSRFLLAFGLCAASTACGGGTANSTVTVIVPWAQGSSEYNAFLTVIAPFVKNDHIQVHLESTQDVTQQLDADLAAGAPPDVVDLPSPAAISQYITLRDLRPLKGISLSSYDEPWRSLAESNGAVYAVPVKADVKSLIWYDERVLPSPPTTWATLQGLYRQGGTWCLGLASGSTSGWPGDDWVADILLSMSGNTTNYEKWLGGGLSWTSSPVKSAWQTWSTLMHSGAAVYGGVPYALQTAYNSATFETAMADGHCELERGALTATGLTPAAGITFTLFPPISGTASPLLVSGDFMAQFSANSNATALLAYLASPSAQKLWVEQPGAYAFSADSDPTVSAGYVSSVQQQIASLLRPGSGRTLCFSAEDMMKPDMSAAFSQAVLDYDYEPGSASLMKLLDGLQQTQQAPGLTPSPTLANLACASP
jgi:alpha-glucoside transport system substrate-binding protein